MHQLFDLFRVILSILGLYGNLEPSCFLRKHDKFGLRIICNSWNPYLLRFSEEKTFCRVKNTTFLIKLNPGCIPVASSKYFSSLIPAAVAASETFLTKFDNVLGATELNSMSGILSSIVKSLFLVGAFSLKEKSPTLTVSSFFLFFSVDNLTLSGPLFLQFVHLSYLFIFHLRPSRSAWVRFSH